MADTLLSPAVGGVMWAATAGITAYSAKKMKEEFDERKVPLMGVLGAFIFAAQMINFSIPGTGSSGHLGGGMLLAILLGPYAGFLTIASVLVVQALFFADGGILALGANIFNLGFFPCFVVYPLIFRSLMKRGDMGRRIVPVSILGSIAALQLGAFGVVLETVFSRVSELPFTAFVVLMQPIHLAIGIVEGIVTAGVAAYVFKAKPELLAGRGPDSAAAGSASGRSGVSVRGVRRALGPLGKVLVVLGVLAVVTGGVFSWFASTHPDGLEWTIFRVAGTEEVGQSGGRLHASLSGFQERLSFLPDYTFGGGERPEPGVQTLSAAADVYSEDVPEAETAAWPSIDAGTSLSGVLGGAITLLIAGIAGFLLLRRLNGKRARTRETSAVAGAEGG